MNKENKMPERRNLKQNEIYTMSNEEIKALNEMVEKHTKEFSSWSEKTLLYIQK
jgi:ssDNA-specific exonuclease RecJ